MKTTINLAPAVIPKLTATTLAIALTFGITSMQAHALDKAAKDGQAPLAAEFKKLDVNSNDLLSQTEAGNDKLFTANNFSKADIDNDGTLDQNEYANYKSNTQKKVVKRVASDSVITSKAKANLLAEKGLKSFKISVETYKGQVILSGFVDNQAAKKQAENVVSKIDGVKSVKNSLVVRS